MLNLPVGEIEEWAIEAIANKVIDARLDQMNQAVVIKSHRLREVKKAEWESIQTKVRLWKEKFQMMHQVLSAAQAHEKTVA